jgi:hypothetical protein
MGLLTNHDRSESGLSNTLPGHRAGSPSLLTLLGPDPKAAAGFRDPPTTQRLVELHHQLRKCIQ